MLSIGEFSKICKVSTKTLRYYAEIGLIVPDEINPENGYRYYSIKQLKAMLLIDRLKGYHFSLEEIKGLLGADENQNEEQLYNALNAKRNEIQKKLCEMEYTLGRLSQDLSNLDKGVSLLSDFDDIEVQLVDTPPMNLLFLRQKLSADDYNKGYSEYFGRLHQKIAQVQLTMIGTPMTLYHSPEFDPAGNDTEFAIQVKERVHGTRDFPGGLCARSVHHGSYAELTSVYARLREWIEQEGYEVVNAPYEVYITDPSQTTDPGELVTEVYFPIKKK